MVSHACAYATRKVFVFIQTEHQLSLLVTGAVVWAQLSCMPA